MTTNDLHNNKSVYTCVSSDTQVLTIEGWKSYADLLDNDFIVSYNNSNQTFTAIVAVGRTSFHYDGPAYSLVATGVTDQVVTMFHRNLVDRTNSGTYAFEYGFQLQATENVPVISDIASMLTNLSPVGTSISSASYITSANATVTPLMYSGDMWCVSVPTSAVVMKRNGLVFVTGDM